MRYGKCAVDGCDRTKIVARGLCSRHYHRWQRHGDPTAGRTPDGDPLKWVMEVALNYDGDECLIWPFSRFENGYGQIRVANRSNKASRFICEEANGPPPTPEHEAAHSCGKGHEGCVNPNHLSWKTPQENHADQFTHGTVARGETHGNSKLTNGQVQKIRSMKGKLFYREIAEIYGVSETAIFHIIHRETWKHI